MIPTAWIRELWPLCLAGCVWRDRSLICLLKGSLQNSWMLSLLSQWRTGKTDVSLKTADACQRCWQLTHPAGTAGGRTAGAATKWPPHCWMKITWSSRSSNLSRWPLTPTVTTAHGDRYAATCNSGSVWHRSADLFTSVTALWDQFKHLMLTQCSYTILLKNEQKYMMEKLTCKQVSLIRCCLSKCERMTVGLHTAPDYDHYKWNNINPPSQQRILCSLPTTNPRENQTCDHKQGEHSAMWRKKTGVLQKTGSFPTKTSQLSHFPVKPVYLSSLLFSAVHASLSYYDQSKFTKPSCSVVLSAVYAVTV